VRHIADRVAVMYLGKIVELAERGRPVRAPDAPVHGGPAVGGAAADPGRREHRERILLRGDVPSPINPPPACRFHTRCWKAQDICRTEEPPLSRRAGPPVACHFPENLPVVAVRTA
jgi:peptide/nickel transport system ATP-binding protein/oligopeptide transport system ATP-binding protein